MTIPLAAPEVDAPEPETGPLRRCLVTREHGAEGGNDPLRGRSRPGAGRRPGRKAARAGNVVERAGRCDRSRAHARGLRQGRARSGRGAARSAGRLRAGLEQTRSPIFGPGPPRRPGRRRVRKGREWVRADRAGLVVQVRRQPRGWQFLEERRRFRRRGTSAGPWSPLPATALGRCSAGSRAVHAWRTAGRAWPDAANLARARARRRRGRKRPAMPAAGGLPR